VTLDRTISNCLILKCTSHIFLTGKFEVIKEILIEENW